MKLCPCRGHSDRHTKPPGPADDTGNYLGHLPHLGLSLSLGDNVLAGNINYSRILSECEDRTSVTNDEHNLIF